MAGDVIFYSKKKKLYLDKVLVTLLVTVIKYLTTDSLRRNECILVQDLKGKSPSW